MTLRQALRKKNKLAGEIGKLHHQAQINNSQVEERVYAFDSAQLFEELCAKVDELIALKTKIAKANTEIYEKVYKVAEYKGLISTLEELDTSEGIHYLRHYQEPIKEIRVPCINATEVVSLIKGFEEKIEALQEEIDTFNSTHEIE